MSSLTGEWVANAGVSGGGGGKGWTIKAHRILTFTKNASVEFLLDICYSAFMKPGPPRQ